MKTKSGNTLIVIENGKLTPYVLDNRTQWKLGRRSPDSNPDICLRSLTISREHGEFINRDGNWFYVDKNGKNGTVYNKEHIEPRVNGRIKPLMLQDGDTLVFGGAKEEVINHKTVWALYLHREFDEAWRPIDVKGLEQLEFQSCDGVTTLLRPSKGTVVEREGGIAIYMGNIAYVIGDMKISGV